MKNKKSEKSFLDDVVVGLASVYGRNIIIKPREVNYKPAPLSMKISFATGPPSAEYLIEISRAEEIASSFADFLSTVLARSVTYESLHSGFAVIDSENTQIATVGNIKADGKSVLITPKTEKLYQSSMSTLLMAYGFTIHPVLSKRLKIL